MLIRILICSLFTIAIFRCNEKANKNSIETNIETFSNEDGSFGYDIYVDNVRKIHQPHIPVVKGVAGFKSENSARKVAELVVKKIKAGEMPPALTETELESLELDELRQ